MSALEQLYQEVILDHYKHPHGKGLLESDAESNWAETHQVNPTCGDEITMRTEFAEDGTIAKLSWEGQGCSISQASASVLAELVAGVSVSDAKETAEIFRGLMSSKGAGISEEDADKIGDGTAFVGVSKFPARIKCALLSWSALKDTMARAGVL